MATRREMEPLTLESLTAMDPRIGALVARLLAQISADCMSRPNDKTARKLNLVFSITPVSESNGEHTYCKSVNMTFDAKPSFPTFKGAIYPLDVTKGGLLFNRDLPEELDQVPMFRKEDLPAKPLPKPVEPDEE